MNQSSAEEYCHSIGGHLVVIEDQYEQTAIAHYLDSILKGMFSWYWHMQGEVLSWFNAVFEKFVFSQPKLGQK